MTDYGTAPINPPSKKTSAAIRKYKRTATPSTPGSQRLYAAGVGGVSPLPIPRPPGGTVGGVGGVIGGTGGTRTRGKSASAPGRLKPAGTSAKAYAPGQTKAAGSSAKSKAPGQLGRTAGSTPRATPTKGKSAATKGKSVSAAAKAKNLPTTAKGKGRKPRARIRKGKGTIRIMPPVRAS